MSGRNRVAAALFAILLGTLGVHKFYLGKPLQGILYLIFCWTFIPTIVGFIEGVVYLSMSDQSFDAAYNGGRGVADGGYSGSSKVQCAKCGTLNYRESRTCNGCRATLWGEPTPAPAEKTCPVCAETIKAAAIKCRYCGADQTVANASA